jgi:hypothetical protein
MSFVLDALRDRPQGLFLMDDSSPLQDYSGHSRTAVLNGTLTKTPSLVNGAAYAPLLSDASTADFSSNIFKQGNEDQAFTLAAWVRPTAISGTVQVLGNTARMDGLVINGNKIQFVIKFATGPDAVCSYELQGLGSIFAVGVYTHSKISLYINRELVDEVTITEDQKFAGFGATTNNLSSGDSTGSQSVSINGVAFYDHALTASSVIRQFFQGRNLPNANVVSNPLAGENVSLDFDYMDLGARLVWDTTEEWNTGYLIGITTLNDELVPQFVSDTSVAGQWSTSVSLDALESSTVYGVVVDWTGVGVTIETSLDGTTWTAATRGQKISNISEGTTSAGKVLQIRATFPGSILNDESYLSRLSVVVLNTGQSSYRNGRTVTYHLSNPNESTVPYEFNDVHSAFIASGGSITISADASADNTPIKTVEVWVKPSSNYSGSFGLANSAVYQNGQPGTTTLTAGQWVIYHVVLSSFITGGITIDIPGNVGRVVTYPTTLTAQNISDLYSSYFRSNPVRVGDSSTITITEPTTAADIYAYDWAITGAG